MEITTPVCECPDPARCIHAEARRSLPRSKPYRMPPASPERITQRHIQETVDGDRQWWRLEPGGGEVLELGRDEG